MKVYIAGTFQDQKSLRIEADALWQLGHEVVGSWLNETAKSPFLSQEQHRRKVALKDVVEVESADLIILDNRQVSGGKNTEWGIGIHSFHHKLMWLVGKPSTVFHHLADAQFPNWKALIKFLKESK